MPETPTELKQKGEGALKTRLIPKLLAALNAEPDKVMFPAGANG